MMFLRADVGLKSLHSSMNTKSDPHPLFRLFTIIIPWYGQSAHHYASEDKMWRWRSQLRSWVAGFWTSASRQRAIGQSGLGPNRPGRADPGPAICTCWPFTSRGNWISDSLCEKCIILAAATAEFLVSAENRPEINIQLRRE